MSAIIDPGASSTGQGAPRLVGGIVLAVVGLGLALFGLRTASATLQQFQARPPAPHDVIAYIGVCALYLFGAAQVAAGAGLCAGGVRLTREGWRRKTYPTEPWMWRSDWAAGAIQYSRGRFLPVIWIAALGWNIPLWRTLVPVVPVQEWIERQAYWGLGAVGVLVFIGGVLVVTALIATARWWRFRASVFEMMSVPGCIGGELDGTVRARVTLGSDEQFRVRLVCEQSPGLGGSRMTLWQPEYTVSAPDTAISSQYSNIPVRFEIPPSCRPTTSQLRNPLVWRLLVASGRAGGYRAEFQVPVFYGMTEAAAGGGAPVQPDAPDSLVS